MNDCRNCFYAKAFTLYETSDDYVKVIRCKDCKWWRDFDCMNANGASGLVLNEDFFCAAGERKDNDSQRKSD